MINKDIKNIGKKLSNDDFNKISIFENNNDFKEIKNILLKNNGFYLFNKALHFYSLETVSESIGVIDWNKKEWVDIYGKQVVGCIFFAQDIFGYQFCIKNKKIYFFDPETGILSIFADSLNEFFDIIYKNREDIGEEFVKKWEDENNKKLLMGKRLLPAILFIFKESEKLTISDYKDIAMDEIIKLRFDVYKKINNVG